VSALRPGQVLQVRIEGASAPVPARIDRIAPTAELGTRGIRVVVALANPAELFRAGQYASAVVQIDDDAQRLTVPIAALGQASGQDFVWALDKGALVRRLVITGRRDVMNGRVEVTRGITADTQLLGARFDGLKEGSPARIVARASTASAASGVPAARPPAASTAAS
jgi:multidrug efflux pump subunit AcrA (membrane-fusion protein)